MPLSSRDQKKELARFDKDRRYFRPPLEARGDAATADAVLDEARVELAALLERVEDPGIMVLRAFSAGAMPYLALFLALKKRGWTAPRVWEVVEEGVRARIAAQPGFVRWMAGRAVFSSFFKGPYKKGAAASREERPGGWTWEWVEADDEHDYGVNYTRCPIQEIAQASGAAEFGRYVCLLDEIMGEELGWGLTRTETIGGGDARCDFRFKKGAPTRVTTRWLQVLD